MLEKTIEILKKLEDSGYTTDVANAKLFSPIKELRTENRDHNTGFLVEMYPALTDDQIAEYVSFYKRHFPEELKLFYKYTNGIRLCDRRISVGGLQRVDRLRPTHGGREYTPIHLIDTWGNSPRERKYWGDGRLFFAIYSLEDLPHNFAYMDCTSDSPIKPVYKCRGGSEEILESWTSFDDWFASEYEKYMKKIVDKEYKIITIADGLLKQMYFT